MEKTNEEFQERVAEFQERATRISQDIRDLSLDLVKNGDLPLDLSALTPLHNAIISIDCRTQLLKEAFSEFSRLWHRKWANLGKILQEKK